MGWFKFKFEEAERKLEAANLQVSLLDKTLWKQDVELEHQKEAIKQVEDDASDFGIDAGFKIFKQLLLELHSDFDMELLESRLSNKVIHEAMDEVE